MGEVKSMSKPAEETVKVTIEIDRATLNKIVSAIVRSNTQARKREETQKSKQALLTSGLLESSDSNELSTNVDTLGIKVNAFIRAYCEAWKERFPESRPEGLRDGKTIGQIRAWIKPYSADRACDLVRTYFKIDDKWFGAKGYDFYTFRDNLNKIALALDSGVSTDKDYDWSKVFG